MKNLIKKITLKIFNSVFSSCLDIGHIESIQLLVRSNLRLREQDIASIKLLIKDNIQFHEDDLPSIKLLIKEKLQINEAVVTLLTRVGSTELFNRLEDIEDLIAGTPLCYSQEGEALILDRMFNFCSEGLFVDVGAHHPKRFSNTFTFYKRGWRGINIDPTPGAKALFDEARPEDISLSVAVSNIEGIQDFYLFSEPALNTFSPTLAREYQRVGCKLLEVRPMESKKLSRILEECGLNKRIDFMSIDVEDHELQVLESNDWQKYRPQVLLVEILDFDLNHPSEYPVHNFIQDIGYSLFAKTHNTLIYKNIR